MATFCHRLPAWCGPDGLPLSWRHFQYGLAYLGRDHLRWQLGLAQAGRLAQADTEGFRSWTQDLNRMLQPHPRE